MNEEVVIYIGSHEQFKYTVWGDKEKIQRDIWRICTGSYKGNNENNAVDFINKIDSEYQMKIESKAEGCPKTFYYATIEGLNKSFLIDFDETVHFNKELLDFKEKRELKENRLGNE